MFTQNPERLKMMFLYNVHIPQIPWAAKPHLQLHRYTIIITLLRAAINYI